jgi:hypothetical protein
MARSVAIVAATAAGSPGPFEMNRPSAFSARIASAPESCGIAMTSQLRSARLR